VKLKVSWLVTNKSDGNLALYIGNNRVEVLKNRSALAKKHNLLLQNLIYMDQTHSDNIVIIEDTATNKIENCDAIITNLPNVPLMVLVADCIPILIFDKDQSVIAAIHAGRSGTFRYIVQKTIVKMCKRFHIEPENLVVKLGVSIHPCCYEVSEDIATIAIKNFGIECVEEKEDSFYLDLQTINFDQIISTGVNKNNIEVSSICSCCSKEYFSYRGDNSGRFAGVIVLHGE
jgi:YfiH family protein